MDTIYLLLCICLVLTLLIILLLIGFILMLHLHKRRKMRARFRPSYEVDTTFQTEAAYDNRGYPGNNNEQTETKERKVENEKIQIRKESEKESQDKMKNEKVRTEKEEQHEQTKTENNIPQELSTQSDQVKFHHHLPTVGDNAETAQVQTKDSSSVQQEGKHESNTNITSL